MIFNKINLQARIDIFTQHDLYRIKKVDDFLAAGFDEYLMDPNGVCLIEWPEVIEPILKLKHQQVCKITIDYHKDENIRLVTIN